jgi:hypothetical protein
MIAMRRDIRENAKNDYQLYKPFGMACARDKIGIAASLSSVPEILWPVPDRCAPRGANCA